MAGAMVDLYCASFRQVRQIVLDLDDTFDAAHGGQQLRLFNAHFDGHGFQPIVVFDGEGRIVAAVLRPARRPSGREIAGHLRRLIRRLRTNWPRVEILIRADSHYAAPEVIELCRSAGVDFVLGLNTNPALRTRVASLEASTAARHSGSGKPGSGKIRRFAEFYDAARSWRRVERIIARIEVGPQGVDTRFIVTSLETGRAKRLYEHLYCRRGEAENHVWTPPALQALSSSFRHAWSAAAMYPAFSAATWPLASMRFAGRLPTIKSSSRLCGSPGLCRLTVRPSCHRVEDRPRSSWKLINRQYWGLWRAAFKP
jgi:hypothetical protein